jgi:hypothetical protein
MWIIIGLGTTVLFSIIVFLFNVFLSSHKKDDNEPTIRILKGFYS